MAVYPVTSAITPETLKRIALQIAQALSPDEIILFGSQATGRAHPDSDVDLLVIMPDSWDQKTRYSDSLARAYMSLRDVEHGVDIILRSRSRAEEYRGDPYDVVGQALAEGRPLYVRGACG